jgi:hypothetical protein
MTNKATKIKATSAPSGQFDKIVMLRVAKGEKLSYKFTVAGGLMPDEDVFKPHSELQASYNCGETWESIPKVWVGRFDDD